MKQAARVGTWLPLLAMMLTVVIWASNPIVSKIILRETSPLMVSLVRFTLAGLLFYLPVFFWLHRGEQRFERRDLPRLLFLGVGGVLGSMLFSLLGLETTPATDAAIYNLTQPLFMLFFAWLLGERLTRSRWAGIGLAFGGAGLLVVGNASGVGGGDLRGAGFLLLSALLWAGYTLLGREILARRSPLLVLATANLLALLAIWPIVGLLGAWSEVPRVLEWSPTAWLVMLYLVILMSTSSQWLYVRAVRDLQPSQVSAGLYTKPFFTAVMAAVFLAELPTPVTIVSGLLILAGVWLVNRPTRRATGRPVARAAPAGAIRHS